MRAPNTSERGYTPHYTTTLVTLTTRRSRHVRICCGESFRPCTDDDDHISSRTHDDKITSSIEPCYTAVRAEKRIYLFYSFCTLRQTCALCTVIWYLQCSRACLRFPLVPCTRKESGGDGRAPPKRNRLPLETFRTTINVFTRPTAAMSANTIRWRSTVAREIIFCYAPRIWRAKGVWFAVRTGFENWLSFTATPGAASLIHSFWTRCTRVRNTFYIKWTNTSFIRFH